MGASEGRGAARCEGWDHPQTLLCLCPVSNSVRSLREMGVGDGVPVGPAVRISRPLMFINSLKHNILKQSLKRFKQATPVFTYS